MLYISIKHFCIQDTRKDFYYDPTVINQQTLLQDFYLKIHTDPSISNVYHLETTTKEGDEL